MKVRNIFLIIGIVLSLIIGIVLSLILGGIAYYVVNFYALTPFSESQTSHTLYIYKHDTQTSVANQLAEISPRKFKAITLMWQFKDYKPRPGKYEITPSQNAIDKIGRAHV